MSITAIMSVHTVTILQPNKASGSAFGVGYDYKPDTPPLHYKCRVVPMPDGREKWQLLERGMEQPHKIHFLMAPVGITEAQRLRWEGVGGGMIMRVMSLPHNSSGLSRQWVMTCDMRTEDQPGIVAH